MANKIDNNSFNTLQNNHINSSESGVYTKLKHWTANKITVLPDNSQITKIAKVFAHILVFLTAYLLAIPTLGLSLFCVFDLMATKNSLLTNNQSNQTINDLTKNSESLSQENSQLLADKQLQAKEINKQAAEINKLTTEIAQLTSTLASLKKSHASSSNDEATKKYLEEIKNLKNTITEREKKCDELKKNLASAKVKNGELEAQQKIIDTDQTRTINEQKKMIEDQKNNLTRMKKEYEKDRNRLDSNISKLQKENQTSTQLQTEQEKQLQSLQSQLNEKSQTISELSEKMYTINQEKEVLKNELENQLEKVNQDSKNTNEKLQAQIDQLTAALNIKEQEYSKVQIQLDQFQKENNEIKEEIQNITTQLETAKRDIEQKTARINELENVVLKQVDVRNEILEEKRELEDQAKTTQQVVKKINRQSEKFQKSLASESENVISYYGKARTQLENANNHVETLILAINSIKESTNINLEEIIVDKEKDINAKDILYAIENSPKVEDLPKIEQLQNELKSTQSILQKTGTQSILFQHSNFLTPPPPPPLPLSQKVLNSLSPQKNHNLNKNSNNNNNNNIQPNLFDQISNFSKDALKEVKITRSSKCEEIVAKSFTSGGNLNSEITQEGKNLTKEELDILVDASKISATLLSKIVKANEPHITSEHYHELILRISLRQILGRFNIDEDDEENDEEDSWGVQ